MKKKFFTRKVCHHFFASINALASTDNFAALPERSRFAMKPIHSFFIFIRISRLKFAKF